ncbi:MAG TPA: DUF3291 domain-containing protein [Solirubrobacterales bacterium]|nr:DUF3291 domain-containing protein [Solirubrobacterales bacterium]
MHGWHLAQVNIAVPHEPLESPVLAEFVALLDPVNAIADSTPGFVWRLQDESGDATSIRAFEDESILINLSVWDSIDALWQFVYDGRHLEVMRRRREWFTRLTAAHLALWWVQAGELPAPADGRERIDHLRTRGPTPQAFTFKRCFGPDGEPIAVGAVARRPDPCSV